MIELHNGDCLEIMKQGPDKSVDLILCDLPYGTTQNKWDSIISLDLLWKQYLRIIKDNGVIVLFAAQPFTSILIQSNLKLFKYVWCWEKTTPTNFLNAKKEPLRILEDICVFYKNIPIYNPQFTVGKPYKQKSGKATENYGAQVQVITDNPGIRYPTNIIRASKDRPSEHPTQKPVALLEYLIKTYTNPGDLVLDNTMGSGSTGVACKNTGRSFIGIELNKEYFEIAKKRIEE